MNRRERVIATLSFKLPDDRLPVLEWAGWWIETVNKWRTEGLQTEPWELYSFFGLDEMRLLHIPVNSGGLPAPEHHGAAIIQDEAGYNDIRHLLFTDECVEQCKKSALAWKDMHERGEFSVRMWLDGFFWFPRTLLGITGHFNAFYENPELIRRMNGDLADHLLRVMEEVFPILKPDLAGFAEDMSYNNGPMISYDMFREFQLPYYKKLVPYIKSHGVKVLVDSDGKVDMLIPWLLEAGVEGVYPLERQSGVDVAALRKQYPDLLLMGGYDKMAMPKGEASMRAEFERLLPVMRSGGYIPSVDHQTPPGVSLENYKIYVKLLVEYCTRAVV